MRICIVKSIIFHYTYICVITVSCLYWKVKALKEMEAIKNTSLNSLP